MVGSFTILAILFVIRIWWGTLTGKFRWMSKVLPILNYALIVMAVVFVIFTIIKIVIAIIDGGKAPGRSGNFKAERQRRK